MTVVMMAARAAMTSDGEHDLAGSRSIWDVVAKAIVVRARDIHLKWCTVSKFLFVLKLEPKGSFKLQLRLTQYSMKCNDVSAQTTTIEQRQSVPSAGCCVAHGHRITSG